MPVSDAEIEALRFHLGYGNVGVGALPYTDDGFYSLFTQVIQPNLMGAAETTSTGAIAAGIATVTPASMVEIVSGARLVVDVGGDAETVVVKAVTLSTFTARFAADHVAGIPVCVESGITRLRGLLHQANTAFEKLNSPGITQTAGIKQLGQGEIEFFQGNKVLADTRAHYQSIVSQLATLVRVPCAGARGRGRLEAY